MPDDYPAEFIRHRERIRAWLLGKEYFKAIEALEFAAKYHTGLRKDGKTPAFQHQIAIAHYLRTLPLLRDQHGVLTTAFLHDVVEDYNVPLDTIAKRFGDHIASAVSLISKQIGESKKSDKDYYMWLSSDAIASIVKGADRIHNFQTMPEVFTSEKQLRYIEECEQYILPMLKEARNNFPDQELAYENIKHALKGQIELLKLINEGA